MIWIFHTFITEENSVQSTFIPTLIIADGSENWSDWGAKKRLYSVKNQIQGGGYRTGDTENYQQKDIRGVLQEIWTFVRYIWRPYIKQIR